MTQTTDPGASPEPRPEAEPVVGASSARPRRRRRATGGVPPTREVADVPLRDTAEDWREGGSDDDRITREVPPHW